MVRDPRRRSSLDDRSDLTRNVDGSIDIVISRAVPPGHERNWLPAPAGAFRLMLRAYLPGPGILNGTYRPPRVERV